MSFSLLFFDCVCSIQISILFFWTHFCKLSSIEAIIRVNHMRLRLENKKTHTTFHIQWNCVKESNKSQLDWTKISENDNYRTHKMILSLTIIPIPNSNKLQHVISCKEPTISWIFPWFWVRPLLLTRCKLNCLCGWCKN